MEKHAVLYLLTLWGQVRKTNMYAVFFHIVETKKKEKYAQFTHIQL